MTPQELKNSILQLAIQGKLVEQRPEEGTGEELYQQIQAEKQRLIDVGKFKKAKILPEITKEEKPFDIPKSWFWVRLGNIFMIERGGSPRPIKDYLTTAANGVNWIKIGDTEKGGKYISGTQEKIKPEGIKKSRLVYKGDFLLSNSMSFGRPYILNIDGCIHDGWLVLQPLTDFFDKDYLYYLLSSPMVFHQFCNRVAGAVVNNLNSDKVALTIVPIPPITEQKRIVGKIEELLPYIDRYERAWNRLEDFNKRFPDNMKKSILQLAIQGKLVEQRPEEGTAEELYQQIQAKKQQLIKAGKVYREKGIKNISDDDIPFQIPKTWHWCRLGDITKVITKGSSPSWQGVSYTDNSENGILFVTSENVGMETMLLEKRKYVEAKFNEMHPASILQKGDILTNLVGASIGRTAIFNEDITDANINQAVCIVRLVNAVLSSYVLKYMDSPLAISLMLGNVVDSARANLSLTSVTNLLIPLPPILEQRRIIARLEELLPLCEKLKRG